MGINAPGAISVAILSPQHAKSLPKVEPRAGQSRATVSVVIPTFNRAKILQRALDSVFAQTRPADEIIVVDDGSTDDTRRVIEGYGSRVRYVYQTNAGVGAARNAGIKATTSDFVAFLDSDDLWGPEKLQLQMQALETLSDVALAYCDMAVIDDDEREVAPSFIARHLPSYKMFEAGGLFDSWAEVGDTAARTAVLIGDFSSAMFTGNLIPLPSVIVRKADLDAVGGFDLSTGNTGEDYDLLARLAQRGKAAFVTGTHGRVRRGGGDHLYGQSANMARRNLETIQKFAQIGPQPLKLPASVVRWRWREAHAWVGYMSFAQGDMVSARRHFVKAVQFGRRDPNLIGHLALTLVGSPVRRVVFAATRKVLGASR